jgi:hypothetical protein
MSEPASILRVTVGTPVYTQDGAKVGKVKEVRGQALKVETGLFQRDYWVNAQSVAEAVPDLTVTLAVEKSNVDTVKVEEPQAA